MRYGQQDFYQCLFWYCHFKAEQVMAWMGLLCGLKQAQRGVTNASTSVWWQSLSGVDTEPILLNDIKYYIY